MLKPISYILLTSSVLSALAIAEEENLYEACSNDSHFCCEANGNVVKIVKPHDIYGDYNIQNAQAYCEKNYGATVSLNTSDFEQTVNLDIPDPHEVAAEKFLEID
jgi:Fe2+ or Zn2+ uptake regulation protein